LLSLKKFLSDSKMFELDKHYRECQKNNQPFIKARKNPIDDNYLVQMDLITCNYNLTIKDQNNVRKLFEKETDYLKSNNSKKPIFKGCNIDKELAWYDGILPERLDTFCEKLFDLSGKSS
jgi:hypothetical protein